MGPTAAVLSSSNLPGFLSLRQFILRREALCLYRQFLRVSRDVGGEREREEMRRWVRGEFDKWRHTTDEGTVRLLLTQGRQSLNDIKTSIEMAK